MALFGPDGLGGRCLLLRAKPTSRSHARTSQFDPRRTLASGLGCTNRAAPALATLWFSRYDVISTAGASKRYAN